MDISQLGLMAETRGTQLLYTAAPNRIFAFRSDAEILAEVASLDPLAGTIDRSAVLEAQLDQVLGMSGVAPRRTARLVSALLEMAEPRKKWPSWITLPLGVRLARIDGEHTLRLPHDRREVESKTFIEALVIPGDNRFRDRLTRIEYYNSTTGAVILVEDPKRWITRMIGIYFRMNSPASVWRYSDAGSKKSIRPMRRSEYPQWGSEQRRMGHLLACGRLLGMALRYDITAGVDLSPATIALLQTMAFGADLDRVARAEDRSAWNAIDDRRYIKWSDDEAVDRFFDDNEIPMGADPWEDKPAVDKFLMRYRINRIVLSIHPEMQAVREGIYQVFPRMGHLDLLSPAKLHSAIRGPANLTAEIVIAGTQYLHCHGLTGGEPTRVWYEAAVHAMSESNRSNLVRYITGVAHPPISYARPGSKWMKVHFYASDVEEAGQGVPLPWVSDGILYIPQFPTGEQLARALGESLRITPAV